MMIELTDLDNKKIYLNKYQIISLESWKLDTDDAKRLDQDFSTFIKCNHIHGIWVRDDVMTVLKKIEGVR